jgi:predicted nucleic-acid-binding Zn-ribbon protein
MVPDCPKCRVRMEEGFIKDITHGAVLVSKWVEGAPEKGLLRSVKTRKKRQLDVATYRCTRCGYLESYAE